MATRSRPNCRSELSEHRAPARNAALRRVCADKFDLRRDILFKRRVVSAHWQEESRLAGGTDTGEVRTARFLITAIGALSAPTLPRIEGLDSFQGISCHTAHWPHEPVSFEGKRVAVIGTGATGVQTIQEVAKTAAHLTVFQRTPNWCAPLHNGPITEAQQSALKSSYPEIFQRCRDSVSGFIHNPDPRRTLEVSAQEREAFWEQRYGEPGFGIWVGNFRDVLMDRDANALMSDCRPQDPATGEKPGGGRELIPRNHGFGTRRLPLRPVITRSTIRPTSNWWICTRHPSARHGERDSHIGARVRVRHDHLRDRLRRADRRLRPHRHPWYRRAAPEGPVDAGRADLLRHPERRISNLLMVMGPDGRTGQYSAQHRIQRRVGRPPAAAHAGQGPDPRRARQESVQAWMDVCRQASVGLLSNEVNSWMTGVNANVQGKSTRVLAWYSGTGPDYRAVARRSRRGLPRTAAVVARTRLRSPPPSQVSGLLPYFS
jgi:hypothetical protein